MEKILEEIVPTEFQLSQNYPNPFKEWTTIKYCVPDKMNIMLAVFNSDGRKVKTLLNEVKEAGTYKVEFYANKLASGEYLYKLELEDPESSSGQGFFDTKKMFLLK